MVEQGRHLASLSEHMVIKIPTTYEGLKAMRTLSSEGIKINATLVFSVSQALLVAKAGAAYVSPFIGRLDDVSEDGMDVIEEIVEVYANYDFETEVLAASIRHPLHVVQSALIGADVATIPPQVIQKLVAHPLTDKGLDAFMADWRKLQEGTR
jgi:transaldolase